MFGLTPVIPKAARTLIGKIIKEINTADNARIWKRREGFSLVISMLLILAAA
jgi:hypothetical protein